MPRSISGVQTIRTITYKPTGACCTEIEIKLDGDIIQDIRFINGCHGNHQGIQSLVRGQKAAEVVSRLQGIVCRNGTSCPDQLARALQAALTSADAQ